MLGVVLHNWKKEILQIRQIARNILNICIFTVLFLTCFLTSDTTTKAKADAKDFWVNMPNLIAHLKKVAEQKPQATYYNVDMLKYQVSSELED